MAVHHSQQPHGLVAEQRASNELVTMIRKLRWMGLEEEAQGKEDELVMRGVTAAPSVVASPGDTD